MQRLMAALVAALTITVIVFGLLTWSAQRQSDDRLEEMQARVTQLVCLERAHVTAAIALMVPESRVDVEGRIESVKVLGKSIDEC